MKRTIYKTTSGNPHSYAHLLVACLGADKGVPALAIEILDGSHAWAVVTDIMTIIIEAL